MRHDTFDHVSGAHRSAHSSSAHPHAHPHPPVARSSTCATTSTVTSSSSDSSSSSSSSDTEQEDGGGATTHADPGAAGAQGTGPSPSDRRRIFAQRVPTHKRDLQVPPLGPSARTKWRRLVNSVAPSPFAKAKRTGTFTSFASYNLLDRPPIPPPPDMVLPTPGHSAGGTAWIVPPEDANMGSLQHALQRRIQALSAHVVSPAATATPSIVLSSPAERHPTRPGSSAIPKADLFPNSEVKDERHPISPRSPEEPQSSPIQLPFHLPSPILEDKKLTTARHVSMPPPLPPPGAEPIDGPDELPKPARPVSSAGDMRPASAAVPSSSTQLTSPIESRDRWDVAIRELSTVGDMGRSTTPVRPPKPRVRMGTPSRSLRSRQTPSLPILTTSSASLPPPSLHPAPSIASRPDATSIGPKDEVAKPSSTPTTLPSLLHPAPPPHPTRPALSISFASSPPWHNESQHTVPDENSSQLRLKSTPEANEEQVHKPTRPILQHHSVSRNGPDGRPTKKPTVSLPSLPSSPSALQREQSLQTKIIRRDRMLVRSEWTVLESIPDRWDELAAARVPYRVIGPWEERLVVLRDVGGGQQQVEFWAPQEMHEKFVRGLKSAIHPPGSLAARDLDQALLQAPSIGRVYAHGLKRVETILVGDKRVRLSLYSSIDFLFCITVTNPENNAPQSDESLKKSKPSSSKTRPEKMGTVYASEDTFWASDTAPTAGAGTVENDARSDAARRTSLMARRRMGGGTQIYLFTPPSHHAGLAWIWALRTHSSLVGARMTTAVTTSLVSPTVGRRKPTMASQTTSEVEKETSRKSKMAAAHSTRRVAPPGPIVPYLDVAVPDIDVRVRIPVPANDTPEVRELLGLVPDSTNQVLGQRLGQSPATASAPHPPVFQSSTSGANGLGYRLLTPQVIRHIVSRTMVASGIHAPQDDAARWAAWAAEADAAGTPLRLAWRIGARLEWIPESDSPDGEVRKLARAIGSDPDGKAVIKGLLLATREHPKPKLELRRAMHVASTLPTSLIHRSVREVDVEEAGESPDSGRGPGHLPDLVPVCKKGKQGPATSTGDGIPTDTNGLGSPNGATSAPQSSSTQGQQPADPDQIEQPPKAEGFLWRVRPVSGTLTRMYTILCDGRLFSCPSGRAFPPPHALLRLLSLTAQGPPEDTEADEETSPVSDLPTSTLPTLQPTASHFRRPSLNSAGTSGTADRLRTLRGSYSMRPGFGRPSGLSPIRTNSMYGMQGRATASADDTSRPTGWNAQRAYLLDHLMRSLSQESQAYVEASQVTPVEAVAIPAAADDLDRLLAQLLRAIRLDIAQYDHHAGTEEASDKASLLEAILGAYYSYEQHRQTLQLQNAEGFVDASDVVQSRLLAGKVSLSSVKDRGGQEGLADAGPYEEQEKIQQLRQMEVVLANGSRVVMEAFSVAAAVRWVELIRAHTVYDRAQAKVNSSDLMRLGGFANTHAHHGQAWGEMSTILAKLWTWCPIDACHAVRAMGPLYRKHSARAPFERRTYVLTRGVLTGFMITHSQKSARARLDAGIFHKRVTSIPLEGAYVYSGALALEWIPRHAQHAAPGASALAGGGGGGAGANVTLADGTSAVGAGAGSVGTSGPLVAQAQRVYADGMQTSDPEADCLFVIRYRTFRLRSHRHKRRSRSHSHGQDEAEHRDMFERTDANQPQRPTGTPLENIEWSGKNTASLILLARSRAERDLWVKQIAWEMERI